MASTSKEVLTDAEIDRLLALEGTAVQRQAEVERILKAFKLNPYEILGLEANATPEEIKKQYKKLSLFIHPDKTAHEKAPEAFDKLKKAENELSEKDKREELDAVIKQARNELLRGMQLAITTPDDHPKLQGLKPPFKEQLKAKSKDMLIQEELRKRRAVKLTMANEGREAQQKEQEAASKKRKAEDDQVWEERREQRVDSWRSFASGPTKKKKKTKVEILG